MTEQSIPYVDYFSLSTHDFEKILGAALSRGGDFADDDQCPPQLESVGELAPNHGLKEDIEDHRKGGKKSRFRNT